MWPTVYQTRLPKDVTFAPYALFKKGMQVCLASKKSHVAELNRKGARWKGNSVTDGHTCFSTRHPQTYPWRTVFTHPAVTHM